MHDGTRVRSEREGKERKNDETIRGRERERHEIDKQSKEKRIKKGETERWRRNSAWLKR